MSRTYLLPRRGLSPLLISLVCALSLVGCHESIETIPAPQPPPIMERAREFDSPLGDLNEEIEDDLNEWIRGVGGVSTLSALLIVDVLLGTWLDSLLTAEEMSADAELSEALEVNGWARLTLPCDDQGQVVLSLILEPSGVSPIVWGVASQCVYAELGLSLDGEINLLIPNSSHHFSRGSWGDDEPDGVWVELRGDVELNGVSASVDQIIMREATLEQTRTIWEQSDRNGTLTTRLILTLPQLDWSAVELGDLAELSLDVESAEGFKRCDLASQECRATSQEESP